VNFVDRTLTCVECASDFTFSVDEQAFHQERGFTNEPRRCPSCRARRRSELNGGGGGGYNSSRSSYGAPREMFTTTCSQCGKEAQVPFQPRGDRPVYCADCFRSQRSSGGYGQRY
jgi:CxxC-x17-CxxC domain-containing protein